MNWQLTMSKADAEAAITEWLIKQGKIEATDKVMLGVTSLSVAIVERPVSTELKTDG